MKKFFATLSLFIAFIAITYPQTTYRRIVSLVPSVTQSLYLLEAQDLLVGCTNYCKAAEKDHKPIVATAIKSNIEKIVTLEPDLVLGSGLTDPKDVATLEKLGIKVIILPSPRSFDEICTQFTELGRWIGREQQAADIVSESREKVRRTSEAIRWQKTPKIFFQIGADPIFAVTENSFMADFITFLKGENIAKELNHGTVGREFVLSKNPDYIIITTMGMIGEEEKKIWSRYRRLKATRHHHILIIDSDLACEPTPLTFATTLEKLYEMIFPKY